MSLFYRKGWRNDSIDHSLAAQGVETRPKKKKGFWARLFGRK